MCFLTSFYQPHCGDDDDDDDGDEIVKLYTLFSGKCLFRPVRRECSTPGYHYNLNALGHVHTYPDIFETGRIFYPNSCGRKADMCKKVSAFKNIRTFVDVPGELLHKIDGDARRQEPCRRKIQIKPPRETNMDVALKLKLTPKGDFFVFSDRAFFVNILMHSLKRHLNGQI